MSFGLSAAVAGFSIFTWSKIGGEDRQADTAKTPRKGRRGGTPKRQRAEGASPGEVTTPPATLPGLKTPTSKAPATGMTGPRSRWGSTARKWRTPASLV